MPPKRWLRDSWSVTGATCNRCSRESRPDLRWNHALIRRPAPVCEDRRQRRRKGEELVAGQPEKRLGGRPQEFVAEAEQAIGDEIEVEMLARQPVFPPQQPQENHGRDLE